MDRSRSMPMLMSIESMYKLTKRENAVWGVEGYEVPKRYFDSVAEAKNKEFFDGKNKNKKGQKSTQHITKKGHFLDDIAKQTMGVPGPQQKNFYDKAADDKTKAKARPKSAPADRGSYIDDIIRNEKKRGNPGVGKYDVIVTLKDQLKKADELSKRKINYGVKACFLSDYELLGDTLPGPGNYNPREVLPKLKQNSTKPEQWIKKHKEIDEKGRKSKLPAVGSYTHHPSDYKTFGMSLKYPGDKNVVVASSIQYWGKEKRFPNLKDKNKAKTTPYVLDPMIAQWPGKEQGIKNDKGQHWMNRVSKGVQLSIYH